MLAFILVLEDDYIGFDRVNATRFPYADLFPQSCLYCQSIMVFWPSHLKNLLEPLTFPKKYYHVP